MEEKARVVATQVEVATEEVATVAATVMGPRAAAPAVVKAEEWLAGVIRAVATAAAVTAAATLGARLGAVAKAAVVTGAAETAPLRVLWRLWALLVWTSRSHPERCRLLRQLRWRYRRRPLPPAQPQGFVFRCLRLP